MVSMASKLFKSDNFNVSKFYYLFFNFFFKKKFILKYARIANQMKITEFLISHELQSATQQCPSLWQELLSNVRKGYCFLKQNVYFL